MGLSNKTTKNWLTSLAFQRFINEVLGDLMDVVGGILVQYPACLYIRVLALRMHHYHYKSRIPLLACFFDQNLRNSFSTFPQNYDVISHKMRLIPTIPMVPHTS